MRYLVYNVIHSVVSIDSPLPQGTCFSALLNTTSASYITTLPVIGSNTVLQEAEYVENQPFSRPCSFRWLQNSRVWKMAIVMTVHFMPEVALYFLDVFAELREERKN